MMETEDMEKTIKLLNTRVKSLLERMDIVELELKLYKQLMMKVDQDISFLYKQNIERINEE